MKYVMLQSYVQFGLTAIGLALLTAVVIGLAANKGLRFMMGVISLVVTGLLFFNPFLNQKAAEISERNHFASIAEDCKPGFKATVIKALPPSGVIKFGASGDVGRADLEGMKTMLRMKRIERGHQAERIELQEINYLERPPADVYPVLMRRLTTSISFTVLSPVDGEPIIHATVPRHWIGNSHYLGCEPVPASSDRVDTPDRQAMLAFLYEIVSPNSTTPAQAVQAQATSTPDSAASATQTGPAAAASTAPITSASSPIARPATPNRKYMIQAGAPLMVLDDCSRGITKDPNVESGFGLEYKHYNDDLVVLVLNKERKRESEARAYCERKDPPLLWQFYDHVLTCKGYMTDPSKAGPVFHASGYEEPVQRIKAIAGRSRYFEFDYGPFREISCEGEITTGPVRFASAYALLRKGSDLVVHDFSAPFDNIKITPLFACKNYFQMPIDKAAKLTLGAGGDQGKPVTIDPQQLQALQDGQFFGRSSLAERIKSGKTAGFAAPAPTPPPQGVVCR